MTTDADIAAQASDLLARASAALYGRRLSSFDDAVVGLAAACGQPDGPRVVTATVQTRLFDIVAGVWRDGWQPADIHRMATRHTNPDVCAFAAEVVAAELSTYAAATIHPHWHAQVGEIRGRAPVQAGQLFAAERRKGASWFVLMDAAARVHHLLSSLPRLERLTPIPGEGVIAPEPGADEHHEVDERILSRVRRLLAKAESTTFEAEAETFTAGAAALIAKHRISEAMLAAARHREDLGAGRLGPSGRRIGIDNPYETPKAHLLDAVARAGRCRMVWSKEFGFGTVIGFESDLEGVELLFTSLLVQATRAMTSAGARQDQFGRSRTRSFRSSFLLAYAGRIQERLEQVAQEQEQAAAAELAGSAGGGDLLPVLAARQHDVDAAVSRMFPSLSAARARSSIDPEGWNSGRAAANQARLNARTEVRGRGA